jgi:glycosyltransferase involved in cell wall biosynthesis
VRILVVTTRLRARTGAELHVAEVSAELARRGHDVTVLAGLLGPLADETRAAGVSVTQRLRATPRPDVVYGHAVLDTAWTLAHHREAPGVLLEHSHELRYVPGAFVGSIRRYFGVSAVCVDALVAAGAPPDRTALLPNFVDTEGFPPRPPLPDIPVRALVFSNYAATGNHLEAVREACRRASLHLDVVGAGVGRVVERPESLLPAYDLVFAKGRAAIEALAVGCAVVLCDFAGVGPMVTTADYDRLRPMNFGFEALTRPHDPETIVDEIRRFDRVDAEAVHRAVRADASLATHVDRLEQVFAAVVAEPRGTAPSRHRDRARIATITELRRGWSRVPATWQHRLRTVSGRARRVLGARET